MDLFVIFFIFIIANFIIFNFNSEISKKFNLYDVPDFKRKIHLKKISVTGGIFLFFNIILFLFLLKYKFTNVNIFFNGYREFFSLIFLISSLFFIGLYDDKYNLNPFTKLFISTFVIFICVLLNENIVIEKLYFDTLNYSFYLSKLSILFTILSILIFLNALNMFDGIDSQVSTYSLFFLTYLGIKFEFYFFILLLPVFFLNIFFNYKKKIFLGDSGTNVLAALISYSVIKFYNSTSNFPCEEIFLLMLVPGIDMIRLFVIRTISGKNPFFPDKNHIHHLYLIKFNPQITFILIQFQIMVPILIYYFFNVDILLLNIIGLIIYFSIILNLKFLKN